MGPFPESDTGYRSLYSSLKGIKMKEFFHDTRYILIFYVIGDILTTIFAIETGRGYEANFIISRLLEEHGYYIIVLLKIFFIFICFADYLFLKNQGYLSTWNITRHSISIMGILVVINNLLVISGLWSPLYVLIHGI
ncbi:DUF5658 family protein [Methanolobus sp. ZRKC2]|uniref:DUF5658 family protein n=1 Tax=Methanolobus sp. ZRKC2 TaxID=3125783 RepID=UPI00325494E7